MKFEWILIGLVECHTPYEFSKKNSFTDDIWNYFGNVSCKYDEHYA